MAQFGDRFGEFTKDMGWTDVSDMAAILTEVFEEETSKQTVYKYLASTRTPPFARLVAMADAWCLALDWITGRSVYPKWSDDVRRCRQWLRGQVLAVSPDLDVQQRAVRVVELMQQRLPQTNKAWFMKGILGMSLEAYQEFMRCEGEISDIVIPRLAAFANLPAKWFRTGNAELLDRPTAEDIGPEWIAIIDQYITRDHEPEDHDKNIDFFDSHIKRQRLLDSK